jgi:arsenate reductase
MAEGYLRHFANHSARIFSAGIEAHGLNQRAVQVMAEDHIDISGQTSNLVDEYRHIAFDHVITVCDHANERCPLFQGGVQRWHQDFPDPAKARGNEEEILLAFRSVRDQIKSFCSDFTQRLNIKK